jgi:hypothetical protein
MDHEDHKGTYDEDRVEASREPANQKMAQHEQNTDLDKALTQGVDAIKASVQQRSRGYKENLIDMQKG